MRLWLVVALLAACTGGTGHDSGTTSDDSGPRDTAPDTCLSDDYWTGGDRESPMMHPGMNCIDCHRDSGEGPHFEAAGTVYAGLHQEDDCNGEAGVVVEITDADGNVHTQTTNAAGNFYFDALEFSITTPYTARLLVDGVEVNTMVGEQTNTNCAACHTMDGDNDAPGRVSIE